MFYKIIRSTAICPNCKNDIWEVNISHDKARCANCYFERDFHIKTTGSEITKSQEKAANRIKRYFEGKRKLAKFEATMTNYGTLFVDVQTEGNVYTLIGGYFSIGRKGRITLHYIADLCASEKDRKDISKHYAKMLNAHYKG